MTGGASCFTLAGQVRATLMALAASSSTASRHATLCASLDPPLDTAAIKGSVRQEERIPDPSSLARPTPRWLRFPLAADRCSFSRTDEKQRSQRPRMNRTDRRRRRRRLLSERPLSLSAPRARLSEAPENSGRPRQASPPPNLSAKRRGRRMTAALCN